MFIWIVILGLVFMICRVMRLVVLVSGSRVLFVCGSVKVCLSNWMIIWM